MSPILSCSRNSVPSLSLSVLPVSMWVSSQRSVTGRPDQSMRREQARVRWLLPSCVHCRSGVSPNVSVDVIPVMTANPVVDRLLCTPPVQSESQHFQTQCAQYLPFSPQKNPQLQKMHERGCAFALTIVKSLSVPQETFHVATLNPSASLQLPLPTTSHRVIGIAGEP